jgi:DNA-binding NarL/FixJ family response regulator
MEVKMEQIRILIADDQALMRDGLKSILDLECDMKVIATAVNGLEASDMAQMLNPDVILMDIRMPGMNGVESVKIIKDKCPQSKVIMLTTFNDEEYIIDALASGASGYMLKDTEIDKLTEAIRDAFNGKMILPPTVAAKLAEGLSKIASRKKEDSLSGTLNFSEREMEIAGMLVQGFTNRQISSALFISEGTVRNYISGIYGKIGVSDRTNAVLYLKDQGVR